MCQATGQFRVPHCRQNANSPPIQSDRPNSQVEPTSKLSKSPKSKRSKGRFQRVSESAQRTLFLSHTAHQSHTVVHEQTGRRETLTVQPVLFTPLPSPLSRYSAPLAPRLTGSECSELTGTGDSVLRRLYSQRLKCQILLVAETHATFLVDHNVVAAEFGWEFGVAMAALRREGSFSRTKTQPLLTHSSVRRASVGRPRLRASQPTAKGNRGYPQCHRHDSGKAWVPTPTLAAIPQLEPAGLIIPVAQPRYPQPHTL